VRLLIDHDILLYRALWGCKGNYWQKLQTCDYMIEKLMDKLNSNDITLFISGAGNFRYDIAPTYKANRKDQPKPEYLYDAKLYYVKYWDAAVSDGVEADDAIGMAHDDETIVVSSDKDFFQLGGLIYNPVKDQMYEITNPWYFFYMQMLVGDDADNIEGVKNPEKSHHKVPPNFTEATAKRQIEGLDAEQCRLEVQSLYEDQYEDKWFEHYDLNAKLLFLKRADAQEYYEAF